MNVNAIETEKETHRVELEACISFIFKALLKRDIDPTTETYYKFCVKHKFIFYN